MGLLLTLVEAVIACIEILLRQRRFSRSDSSDATPRAELKWIWMVCQLKKRLVFTGPRGRRNGPYDVESVVCNSGGEASQTFTFMSSFLPLPRLSINHSICR